MKRKILRYSESFKRQVVEEYESGVEEIESMRSDWAAMSHQNKMSHAEFSDERHREAHPEKTGKSDDTDNKIHRLF